MMHVVACLHSECCMGSGLLSLYMMHVVACLHSECCIMGSGLLSLKVDGSVVHYHSSNYLLSTDLRKFSLQNLGVWHPLVRQKRAICENFLCKNCIFHQFMKVYSLESFPIYDNMHAQFGSRFLVRTLFD